MPDLRPLLAPDSVAIVGAAADDSLRGRLTKQLVEHGYPGRVYPVTRSQKEVLGHQAYATVAEIPEPADLAMILVPAAHVVSTIEQCGARGVKAAVVISSGFGEEKSEEAAASRHGAARHRATHRDGDRRPELRGSRQPAAAAGRDVQPGVPRPHRAAVAGRQPRQADRGHLPVGRADLRVSVARPRPPAAIHLSDQRRQPDRARSP